MEIKKTKLLSAQPLTTTVTATESLVKVDSNGKVTRIALSRLRDAILGGADVNCMLDGVFIMYHRRNDGTPLMVKPHKWTALQNSGEIADGVAVVDGASGHILVVAPTEVGGEGLPWSSAHISGGAVTTMDREGAWHDFNGRANTTSIIAKSSAAAITNTAAYAPGYCHLYSRTNAAGQGLTAGKWWLPSVGELMIMYANMSKINYCMLLINGGVPLVENSYWASTEASDMRAWSLRFLDGYVHYGYNKTSYKERVRAVSTFIQ